MDSGWKKMLRNFLIEVGIYAVLVILYFFLVLRFLGDFLMELFVARPVLYAFLGLILILAQGVLLERITSFLMERLNLIRTE
jgi:hypothetical protein